MTDNHRGPYYAATYLLEGALMTFLKFCREDEKLTCSPKSFVEQLLIDNPVDVVIDNVQLGIRPVEF